MIETLAALGCIVPVQARRGLDDNQIDCLAAELNEAGLGAEFCDDQLDDTDTWTRVRRVLTEGRTSR